MPPLVFTAALLDRRLHLGAGTGVWREADDGTFTLLAGSPPDTFALQPDPAGLLAGGRGLAAIDRAGQVRPVQGDTGVLGLAVIPDRGVVAIRDVCRPRAVFNLW